MTTLPRIPTLRVNTKGNEISTRVYVSSIGDLSYSFVYVPRPFVGVSSQTGFSRAMTCATLLFSSFLHFHYNASDESSKVRWSRTKKTFKFF